MPYAFGWLVIAVVAASATADSRSSASLAPADLAYASEFIRVLEGAGVRVDEVLRSHQEALFRGVETAAFIRTERGVVEIVVLPGERDAEQLSITYTVNASSAVRHHYVLRGPRLPAEGQLVDAAYPVYYTLHRNWFIETIEPALDDAIKRALGQTRRAATPLP